MLKRKWESNLTGKPGFPGGPCGKEDEKRQSGELVVRRGGGGKKGSAIGSTMRKAAIVVIDSDEFQFTRCTRTGCI